MRSGRNDQPPGAASRTTTVGGAPRPITLAAKLSPADIFKKVRHRLGFAVLQP